SGKFSYSSKLYCPTSAVSPEGTCCSRTGRGRSCAVHRARFSVLGRVWEYPPWMGSRRQGTEGRGDCSDALWLGRLEGYRSSGHATIFSCTASGGLRGSWEDKRRTGYGNRGAEFSR